MSLIGLHIYIAFKIKGLLPQKKNFFLTLIIGIILPESDCIIIPLYNLLLNTGNNIPLFNKSFTHSIITISIIYLIFLVIYEIKKKEYIVHMAKGLILGMTINVLFDTLVRLGDINVFWPLPILTLNNFNYSIFTINIIMILEFIFFRLAAHELIKLILNDPSNTDGYIIKHLSHLMKLELIFILLMIFIMIYFNSVAINIFNLFYIISYSIIICILFNFIKKYN